MADRGALGRAKALAAIKNGAALRNEHSASLAPNHLRGLVLNGAAAPASVPRRADARRNRRGQVSYETLKQSQGKVSDDAIDDEIEQHI
jgi:hypothetical protein